MRRTTMTSGSAARIWVKAQADKRCKTPGCENNGELIMGMRAALCTECIATPKSNETSTVILDANALLGI